MSEMIDRIAKAIEEALDKPKYVVRVNKHGDWELWEGLTKIVSSNNHGHIDRMCDILNNKYAARKAIEALKGEIPSETFFKYTCDKPWKELTSSDVWNLWLNAILVE